MSNMTYLNKDKISLQTSLERNPSKYSYISLFDVNFENLIFGLHPLYVLNKYAKFHINWKLFTIWLINLFFMHNLYHKKIWI